MADEAAATQATEHGKEGRNKDEVALEMMKFIAVTTGYGKTSNAGTGFSAKMQGRTAEEQAEALMDLFDRCRQVVKKDS